jgi:hypothetical protein
VNPSRRVVHVRIAHLRAGVAVAGVALALAGCSVTNPATIATPFDPADGRNGQIGGEPGNGGGDGNYQGNGGIKLRNFLIVSQGNGQPGVVVGAISNDTGQAARVALIVAGTDGSGQATELGTTTVSLPPGGFVQIGNPAGAGGTAGAGSGSSTSGAATSPTSSAAPTPVSSIGSSVSTTLNSSSQSTGPSNTVGTEPAQGQVVWFQVARVTQPAGAVIQLVARDPALGSATIDLPILPPVEEYANLTPTSAAPSPSASASSPGSPGASPTASPQPSANPSGAGHQGTPSTSG